MKFIIMVWFAFLARVNPASTRAKPACMNMTRKPVTRVQTMLMATRFWPTMFDSANASGSRSFAWSISEIGLPSLSLAADDRSFVGLPSFPIHRGAPSTCPTTSPLLPVAVPAGSPFAVDAIEFPHPTRMRTESGSARNNSARCASARRLTISLNIGSLLLTKSLNCNPELSREPRLPQNGERRNKASDATNDDDGLDHPRAIRPASTHERQSQDEQAQPRPLRWIAFFCAIGHRFPPLSGPTRSDEPGVSLF